jgi:hypothetical protein
MAHRATLALLKRRSTTSRTLVVLVWAACTLATSLPIAGCAWWQEPPQQPRTVTDWMKMPRVEP